MPAFASQYHMYGVELMGVTSVGLVDMKKLLTLLCIISITLYTSYQLTRHANGRDFIEFFAAATALNEGLNPYDPATMFRVQNQLVGHSPPVLMMWSPPWVLPLMLPGGPGTGLADALLKWRIWGALLVGIGFLLIFSLLRTNGSGSYWMMMSVVLCAPFLDVAKLAQSTPIFFLSAALFAWAIERRRYGIAGASASLWIIKPHLFLLCGVGYLLSGDIGKKRFFVAASAAVLLLIGVSEMQYPGGSQLWLGTFAYNEDTTYTVPRLAWLCATLGGFIRSALGIGPDISFYITTMSALFLVIASLRNKVSVTFPDDLSWIIPLGLLTAPYGWFYDQALIAIAVFFLLRSRADQPLLRPLCIWILFWNTVAVWYFTAIATVQQDLWWYPLGILVPALWIRFEQRSA